MNLCCVCSLESPHRDDSNEYTQYIFHCVEDRKGFPKLSFVCVEVLQPSQPSGVMSIAVSLPNHTFTEQA